MAPPVPFDPKATCPKCDEPLPRKALHAALSCPLTDLEHLHMTCRECSDEWAMSPKG